jgi:hypothetical protein
MIEGLSDHGGTENIYMGGLGYLNHATQIGF